MVQAACEHEQDEEKIVAGRRGSSIPLSLSPHATWAAPRFAPFIRMAVGCSVRRSIAAYHLLMWESRGDDLEGLD